MAVRSRAFTLRELLVVIGLTLIATLFFHAIHGDTHSHRPARANVQIYNLSISLKAYYNEYGTWPTMVLPNGTNTVPLGSLNVVKLNGLYQILIGNDVLLNKASPGANPRKIVFMEFRPSELKAIGGGLTNIVDPWGTPYQFCLDSKGNNKVPIYSGSKTISAGFAIWSLGRDRKDNPDPNHPDNADNITSWK